MPQRGARHDVVGLLVDGEALWLAGASDGLWRASLATAAPAWKQVVRADELSDPSINVLAHGPQHSIWIGTEAGLNLCRPGQPIERVDLHGTVAEANVVTSLLTDGKGRLWVGTNSGIAVLDPYDSARPPVVRRIQLAHGLPAAIDAMLMDNKGNVWASTDDGLAVIDPVDFFVRALHANDGVAFSSYWINSSAKAPNGDLVFGGYGGLTVIRPDRLEARPYSAAVVATSVKVGATTLAAGQLGAPAHLTVPAQARDFSVDFSVVDFASPGHSRYAYRLDGFDDAWHEVDSAHRSASYTNLSPGHYTLHVKAADSHGQWSDRPLTIDIEVQAAWHQTWWFAVVKGLLAIMVVLAIVALRGRYLRQRSRELERLVDQRTEELRALQVRLEELAYSDALTCLPNRRMLSDCCNRLIATSQRQGTPFGLLLIDLDHFKQINDTRGHDAGDALLVEIAARLQGPLRQSEFVARLGGDEFAILLSDDATRTGIEAACRRIFERFREPIFFDGWVLPANLSIGIALFPADGESQDTLYKSADQALYEAKRAGRNTWRFASSQGAAPTPASPVRAHND